MEITQSEKQTKRNDSNIRDLWENIESVNLHITGVPEREERDNGIENVFEDMIAENIPNLKKETDIQAQEVQRVPNKMNSNRPTPRHMIFKMAKTNDKERILKAERE